MAEQAIFEGVKIRNDLIDAHALMKVWLWDCGPEEPDLPEAPEAPSGKDGEPKYDLAKLKYRRALHAYEQALEKHDRDVVTYARWKTDCGGPMEVMQWSVDARDTLAHDERAVKEGRQKRRRWYVSSRTRGYEKLPNGGLPAGYKPGHGHAANIERQIAGDAEFVKAMRADPVFGQEVRP